MPSAPPDETRWRFISALFARMQLLTPAERQAFFDAASIERDIRREVEDLLEQNDSKSGVFAGLPAPRPSPALPEPFAVGQQVGRYRIVRRLKPGGMGILYVAEDNSLNRDVVLKVVLPELATDIRQRNRLSHEAKAMARLQHANIATVHDFTELEGIPVIVTELVHGRDLRERLRQDGPFDPVPLIDMMLGVAHALEAAHAAGVIHRDLKPENIMLPERGGVKLVDFGIARMEVGADSAAQRTSSGTLVGTLGYMAPEQLKGGPIDHRCDLFAFGVVLYEAATGVHPFEGHTTATLMMNILQAEPAPLTLSGGNVFARLEPIVARCLKKAPELRYPSATELAADLERAHKAYDSGVLMPVTDETEEKVAQWWWHAHQWMVAVWCGLLLIPLWIVRDWLMRGAVGDGLFFGGVVLTVISIMLRVHSSFTAQHWFDSFVKQRRAIRGALLVVEPVYSFILGLSALLVVSTKPGIATLLLVAALGTMVALLVIEPTTTDAAFPWVLRAERDARNRSGRANLPSSWPRA